MPLLARLNAICYVIQVPEAFAAPSDADARIAALEASLAHANAALAARDLLIDTLRGQITKLRHMQFGTSSEKLGREIAQLELALEELETEGAIPDVEATAPNTATRPAPIRALPDHLPREDVVHEPASGVCTCPDCGGTLRRLGMDTHEMLDVMPVRWRVVRQVRPKYSCRRCEKIVQAPAPVSAVARGKATFATLAHVIVAKFDHHLPLYRQAEMMAAQGLDIDRSTLAGWTGQAAALLDPVVTRIRDAVRRAGKIHADDTPVPVLDPGRGRTATGRLWVYAADGRASGDTTPPATWYRFTTDRTGAHPQTHLAASRGFLQADAYAGYDGLYRSGVTEVACWAHFRRKVFDLHERALRGIAVGRRNWLFAGSKVGGERAAAIYTVIQTCKANGVDPEIYIADVIARIADDWPASRWDELMPWNWRQMTDQPVPQTA